MKKLLLLAVGLLLVGCANQLEMVNQTDDAILYFDSEAEYQPQTPIKRIEEGFVYNIRFDCCYIVEYDGVRYQTHEEISQLVEEVGASMLFDLGYEMERVPIDGTIWEKNY